MLSSFVAGLLSITASAYVIVDLSPPGIDSAISHTSDFEPLTPSNKRNQQTALAKVFRPSHQPSDIILQARDIIDGHTVEPQAEYGEFAVAQEGGAFTLYCSGTDLQKKEIASVCVDGTILSYSSLDCGRRCKCDDTGEMSCDMPSGCGPHEDVVEYCVGNLMFGCSCLDKAFDVESSPRDALGRGELSEFNARKRDPDTPSYMDYGLGKRHGTEQGAEDGIPMISPCFYVESMGCDPMNPKGWKTHTTKQAAAATTLARVA